MTDPVSIRPATPDDAEGMAAVLNPIIKVGGTTAYETPVNTQHVIDTMIAPPGLVCCHVALDADGQIAGFQFLKRADSLPVDCADIATFTRLEPRVRGVGTVLFAKTKAQARVAHLSKINAQIRADNVSGLAYYTKMGFLDHDIIKGVPLADGTPVDRVIKRYTL